jgi:type I restriction enzyme S subunit
MNNDWFFEKFALIADAPGAVDRIRELVLQMAIQGRLVQQDPTDEPANATLLKYPSTVSAKFIKTPDAGTPCPKITLPLGWVWNRLTNVLKKLTDGTHHSPPNSNFGEFPYVTAKNIKNHGIEISNLTYVTKELHNEIFSRCNPEHGDLLYIKDGATTGIVAINQLREEFSMLSSVALLKLTGAIDNRYLLWTLRSPFFYNQIRAAMKGAAITRVNLTELAQTWIPLPPLAEQKRIVAKVDELMGLCDELEVQQQERELRKSVLVRSSLSRFAESPTRENLGYLFHNSYDIPPSELRKSILTLAVQGKLVLQDPEDEPAALALERIDAAPKRAMRTRASDNGDGDEPTELEPLFELPPGWEWVPFGRLPLQASVGIDRGRSMQGPEKAVGYFKMNNIRNSGGVDLSDLTRIDATTDEIKTYLLVDGDFLFNTRNSRELVGKTCVYRSPPNDTILYNNNILRVRFIEGFSPDFIDYWFRSPEGSAELENLKSNTTNVCAIYQGKLTGFPCVVPPLAEQHRIVAKVDQLMALVDELERQQAASREKASNLLDAIVQEMTSGG